MKLRILIISSIYLFSFNHLRSQEISFLSNFHAPWNSSIWETSYTIPRNNPQFLDAIAIPFQFPMETSLIYGYTKELNLQLGRTSYSNDFRPDQIWNSSYSMSTNQRGMTYLFRKKNFGLNIDFSLLMTGTIMGLNIAEASETKARLSYRIPSEIIGLNPSITKVDLFLELSDLHSLQPQNRFTLNPSSINQALFKTGENNNRPGILSKQFYASPGISLSRSSRFIFEGQVRVPMNSRESNRTLDELWTPEIQTHLGMKYIIPVAGLE